MTFEALRPARPEEWPQVGRVSRDRVAIVGQAFVLFPFSQKRWAESQEHDHTAAERIAESVAARHRTLSTNGTQALSLFVPDKVASLVDLYPTFLRHRYLDIWWRLQQLLADEPGALFADGLVDRSQPERRVAEMPWSLTANRLNEKGVATLVEVILTRLGVPHVLDLAVVPAEEHEHPGDLGAAWGRPPLVEVCSLGVAGADRMPRRTPANHLLKPGADVDQADEWRCHDAPLSATLLLTCPAEGDIAQTPLSLAWWAVRLFQRVVVVSGPDHDVAMNGFRPDVALSVYPTIDGFELTDGNRQ